MSEQRPWDGDDPVAEPSSPVPDHAAIAAADAALDEASSPVPDHAADAAADAALDEASSPVPDHAAIAAADAALDDLVSGDFDEPVEPVTAPRATTPPPPPPSPGLDLRTAVPAEPFRPATEPVEPVTPASGPAPAIPASAEPVTRASGPAGAPPVAELDPEQVEADLAAVDAALERIDRGAYGRCEVCHVVLDDHVLAADPTVGACPAHIHLTPVAVTA